MNLTPAELERYEERASILEFEAAMPRADAEKLAMEAVIASRMAKSGRDQARALARELRQ